MTKFKSWSGHGQTNRTGSAGPEVNRKCTFACLRLEKLLHTQGPHSQILMMGGSNRGSYFIPKKITTSEFVYPKKSLPFIAFPKKTLVLFSQHKKIPLFFFVIQKIPASFIDQKKKNFDQNYRPKKLTRTPPLPQH